MGDNGGDHANSAFRGRNNGLKGGPEVLLNCRGAMAKLVAATARLNEALQAPGVVSIGQRIPGGEGEQLRDRLPPRVWRRVKLSPSLR